MSTALLLAEPQPETRGFLERHLTSDGFKVVGDGVRPDLVLLGDTAALDACRARHGDVPVIVLGEPESDAVDRVRALDRGCDDFLAKPFDYEELLARIRAVLRRTTPAVHETLRAGPIVAGGLIGSSLIGIFAKAGPHVLGINVISVIGFALSGLLGIWLLWGVVRSGRL
jgi:DNA-binding response OmpR family regulator